MSKNYKLIVNFSVRSLDDSDFFIHHMTMWVPDAFVEKMREAMENGYARQSLVILVAGWMRVHMFGEDYQFTLLNHTVWDHKGNLIWEGEV